MRILVSSLQIIQLVTKAVDCKTVTRTAVNIVKAGFLFFFFPISKNISILFLIGLLGQQIMFINLLIFHVNKRGK